MESEVDMLYKIILGVDFMKKLLATILVVIMIFSLTMVAVNATESEYNFEDNLISLTVRDTRYKVTLEKLSPYGVVNIEKKGLLSYVLTLDKHDHQNVIDVISQIRSTEDGYMCRLEPVYIEEPEVPDTKVYMYKDKFIEQELDLDSFDVLYDYDELYYHFDVDGNIDWALVYAYTGPFGEALGHLIVGNRIICVGVICFPFSYKYGVYDVKEDKFVAIDEYIDYSKYDELKEYVESNLGVLLGDADNDDELTVFDATKIQLYIAKLSTSKENIHFRYYCDIDRDGHITVLDATAVQLKIAKLD